MKRRVYMPDLADFINNNEADNSETQLTDAFKARILQQFLHRFRLEFDTEMDFREVIQEEINKPL